MADGRQARGAHTRAALVEATLRIIATEGADAVTQRKVARAAGTSLASTTYHFPAAADLLVAAFEESARRSGEVFDALARRVASGELELLDAAMDFAGRSPTADAWSPDTIPQLVLAAARRPELRPTAESFLERMAAGFSPFLDSTASALTLARALTGLILHEMQRGERRPSQIMREDVSRLFEAFGLTDQVQRAVGQSPATTRTQEIAT